MRSLKIVIIKYLRNTVFPHMVSAETILFLNLEIVANSNSCRNISILYMINTISAAETIQGRKLYEEYSIQMVQLKKKLIIFPSKKPDSCSTNVLTLLLNYYLLQSKQKASDSKKL